MRSCRLNALNRKTRTERKAAPVFQILVEVQGFDKLHIHMCASLLLSCTGKPFRIACNEEQTSCTPWLHRR